MLGAAESARSNSPFVTNYSATTDNLDPELCWDIAQDPSGVLYLAVPPCSASTASGGPAHRCRAPSRSAVCSWDPTVESGSQRRRTCAGLNAINWDNGSSTRCATNCRRWTSSGASPLWLFAGGAGALAQVGEGGSPAFRVRSDFTAGLNRDTGWAGAANEDVTIHADRPFRIRFEVIRPAATPPGSQFRLQFRRNAGEWARVEAHDFPHPESDHAKTPRISIVACAAYMNDTPTTDLLSGATNTFQPGVGVGGGS